MVETGAKWERETDMPPFDCTYMLLVNFYIQIDPVDYRDTEYILVDPSCSGSGIFKRLSYHNVSVVLHCVSVFMHDYCWCRMKLVQRGWQNSLHFSLKSYNMH